VLSTAGAKMTKANLDLVILTVIGEKLKLKKRWRDSRKRKKRGLKRKDYKKKRKLNKLRKLKNLKVMK